MQIRDEIRMDMADAKVMSLIGRLDSMTQSINALRTHNDVLRTRVSQLETLVKGIAEYNSRSAT